jgi:hypothetical protein
MDMRSASFGDHTVGSVLDLVKPYVPTLAVVGAVVAILAVGLGTSSAVLAVSSRLDRQDVSYRAKLSIEQLVSSPVYPVQARICGDNPTNQPICKVLELRSFPRLGEHDDLWVFFDAALTVHNGELSNDDRRNFNTAMAGVVAALSADGAWDAVRSRGTAEEQIVATDLYLATIAQAAKCKDLADVLTCGSGIPAALSVSLSRLAILLRDRGPVVAAYEMTPRSVSVQAVIDSGLVDGGIPRA